MGIIKVGFYVAILSFVVMCFGGVSDDAYVLGIAVIMAGGVAYSGKD